MSLHDTLEFAPSSEIPNVELSAQSIEDGFGCLVTVLDDATGEQALGSSVFEFRPSTLVMVDSVPKDESTDSDSDNDEGGPHESKGHKSCASTTYDEEYTAKGSLDGSVITDTALGCSAKWTRFINKLRQPVMIFLQTLATAAANHPRVTILAVVALSMGLMLSGLATNFVFEVDEAALWTPFGSKPEQHGHWIENESGFPPVPNGFALMFHSNGENVLGQEQVTRIFDAIDSVRYLDGYDAACQDGDFVLPDGTRTCEIFGATRFWLNNRTTYERKVNSDADAILGLSSIAYPDGIPVTDDQIFGNPERVYSTGLLTSATSYTVVILLPETDETKEFEERAIDTILQLRQAWATEPGNSFRVELWTTRSIGDEYTRAVYADLPLVPIVFITMATFTSLVFFKRHKVHSRSLLGIGAVVAILLSMVSSYGLMFLCGVPFTSVTQLLPFVMFGIGLDDAFIIMGAFSRLGSQTDPVQRIKSTIDEVGLSISLTTMTSALAFGLGCISSVPAIYWLCLYAFPSIIFIFLYQLTFFVALITLDQRRIQQNRRDCCVCITAKKTDNDHESSQVAVVVDETSSVEQFANRLMGWYAKQLLRRWVKVMCIIAFVALTGLCAWSASKMEQQFKFSDILPQDSFMSAFARASDAYASDVRIRSYFYFRDVDQSDEDIQEQMKNYIDEIGALRMFQDKPDFCWLRDFNAYVNSQTGMDDLPFNEQVDSFLSIKAYNQLYSNNLVRDQNGTVLSSRCATNVVNVNPEDANDQVSALMDQRAVTERQPINAGKADWSFFTFSTAYNMWEFYSVLVDELILTSVLGMVAVSAVAIIFIPHWTAVFFVMPLVAILYIDLIGVLQWAGIDMNAVSYITLVMSIGLFVDYLMHVLLRYYEAPGNRHEKTVDMFQTMGVSILMGGISTLLGTVPLAFSTSLVFNTVFIAFLGLVTLGLAHGLILLPVILSILGPEEQLTIHS